MLVQSSQAVFPYVFGSLAFSLGKKADSFDTHRWMCYVRGLHNQDLTYLVKKVVFNLHSSFQNPVIGAHILFRGELGSVSNPAVGLGRVRNKNINSLPASQHAPCRNAPYAQSNSIQFSSTTPMLRDLFLRNHFVLSFMMRLFFQTEMYFFFIQEYIDKFIQERDRLKQKMAVEQSQKQSEEPEVCAADKTLKDIALYEKLQLNFDSQDHKNKISDGLRFINGEIKNLQEKIRLADSDVQKVYEDLYNNVKVPTQK